MYTLDLVCQKHIGRKLCGEESNKDDLMHLVQQLCAAPAVYSCLWSHVIKSVSQHRAVTISHCSGLMTALHVVRLLTELWDEVRGQESDLQHSSSPAPDIQ